MTRRPQRRLAFSQPTTPPARDDGFLISTAQPAAPEPPAPIMLVEPDVLGAVEIRDRLVLLRVAQDIDISAVRAMAQRLTRAGARGVAVLGPGVDLLTMSDDDLTALGLQRIPPA